MSVVARPSSKRIVSGPNCVAEPRSDDEAFSFCPANSHTPRYHPLKPLRSRLVSIPSGPELTASFCFKPWPNQVCESQLPLLLVIHTLPLQELAFLASKLISKPSITNSNTAATSIYMFNGWCKYKFTHVTLSMATLVFAV